MHPDHLGNVAVRCIQHSLQKDLNIPSRWVASKPLVTPHMEKKCLQFALRYLHWKFTVPGVRSWWLEKGPVVWWICLSVHVQQRIKGIWVQKLTPEYFLYLAVSMPKNLQSVIKAKGHTTKWCIIHVYVFCMIYYSVLRCFILIFELM